MAIILPDCRIGYTENEVQMFIDYASPGENCSQISEWTFVESFVFLSKAVKLKLHATGDKEFDVSNTRGHTQVQVIKGVHVGKTEFYKLVRGIAIIRATGERCIDLYKTRSLV